jgi:hypothetical protein
LPLHRNAGNSCFRLRAAVRDPGGSDYLGGRTPAGAGGFFFTQAGFGAHLTSCSMCIGVLSGIKWPGRAVPSSAEVNSGCRVCVLSLYASVMWTVEALSFVMHLCALSYSTRA